MLRKELSILALGLAATLYSLCGFRLYYFDTNECSMSWSRPVYVPLDLESPNSKVSSKYQTYLYREGGLSPLFESADDVRVLGGTPVLFLPGNAGTYNQGRSLASLAYERSEFDWFLVDFDEDLSAMHGKTLLDEAEYVNDAIAGILALYEGHDGLATKPESVIIVGHSMGGLVARTLIALDSYVPDSVNTIITLSTPHAYPPITFDRDITQIYDLVNQFWRKNDDMDITLVSIAGGHNDLLVLPDMTLVDSLGGLSVFSYEIPDVGIGIDHLAIVWCAELRKAVTDAIAAICDHRSPYRTLPPQQRMKTLHQLLKKKTTNHSVVTELPRSMLFGLSQDVEISTDTELVLPARTSLVSYTVDADKPVGIVHATTNEQRDYGVASHTTIMWYSSGPFVPFKVDDQRLRLKIRPNGLARVSVKVNWMATAANIAIHYRTLAACWPLAIVFLVTLIVLQRRISFGAAFTIFLSKWYLPLSLLLAILHLGLSWPAFRNAVRRLQVPSEAANIRSLRVVGFDVHDLLIGISDPELVFLPPVLLAVACCAVLAIHLAAFGVSSAHAWLSGSKQAPAVRPRGKIRYGMVLLSVILLYLIPYQVATCILAIALLCRVADVSSFGFAYLQILLWTAVIDSPIVVVWLRNLNFEWLWAFATLRNLFSTAPICLLALSGTQWLSNPRPIFLRITQVVLLYITMFAFIFGGLHAFMLHHLVNYMAAWLLVVMYDSAPEQESRKVSTI